jgi:hypothetical protein
MVGVKAIRAVEQAGGSGGTPDLMAMAPELVTQDRLGWRAPGGAAMPGRRVSIPVEPPEAVR